LEPLPTSGVPTTIRWAEVGRRDYYKRIKPQPKVLAMVVSLFKQQSLK
jgi:hypothetical protein